MLQNIIALTIVFSAFGYTVYSLILNLRVKKSSKCGSCEGCAFKESLHSNTSGSGIQGRKLYMMK